MKFYLKLTLLFALPLFGFAQDINNANTLKKTLELAQKKNQPILLIINMVTPTSTAYKISENLAIKEQDVIKKIKDNFIVFETNRTDTSIRNIISTHKINRFPTFLFMHPTKDVFHMDFGHSSTKHKYLAMIDKALLMSKEKTITELQSEYQKNQADYTLLKQLIELRKRNGVRDNAELIEKYVYDLKIGDFNDYQTVLFVLEAGPFTDGNAYKLAYTNRKIIDSIYKKVPLQLRTEMNNTIIGNTMVSAVKTKNRMRAQSGANFARNSWAKDYIKGNKIYGSQMLYFYYATKDTANYFRAAIQHYDMYYMNISADSIKKVIEKERQAMLVSMRPPTTGKNIVSKEKIDSLIKANPNNVSRRTESVLATTASISYSNDLNTIAYRFYQSRTKNLNYLTKAMIWSKRSIELDPKWVYFDTLAHIYYAMEIHSEALATQKIAMNLAKKESNPEYLIRTTREHEKMKNKTL